MTTKKAKPTTKAPDDYVSYGFSKAIASVVPEIGKLLTQAAAGKWDAQRFSDALQNTTWWKTHSDTAKQFIQMQAQDPKEYAQELTNAKSHAQEIANSLGVKLSAADITAFATSDLFSGLDDQTLTDQIGAKFGGLPSQGANGQAVTLDTQIRQFAAQQGVPVTDSFVNGWIKQALSTGTDATGALKDITNQAASLFPPIAAQIQAGQTVQQIAQPYTAQMSQLLEIPDTEINVNDPTIQKALLGQLPSSAGTNAKTDGSAATAPTTLYDFGNAIRNDPRWDATDNAKASAFQMSHDLLKSFGATAI